MKKLVFAVLTVFLFTNVGFSAIEFNNLPKNLEELPQRVNGCQFAANAAELESCCSPGCDTDLWLAVYTACERIEQ